MQQSARRTQRDKMPMFAPREPARKLHLATAYCGYCEDALRKTGMTNAVEKTRPTTTL